MQYTELKPQTANDGRL